MAPNPFRLIGQSYRSSTVSSYASRLSTSWLLSPWVLFSVRASISLYAFVVIFTIIGYDTTNGRTELAEETFSYFTDLTYWGLAFYFAFAAAHSGSYAARGRPWLESWPGWLKWLHSAFYMTITVYPFIVTAVYWAVLSEGAFFDQFSTWSNISQHAMNSVFAFLEIIIPRSDPHPWLLLAPLIFVLALYLGLAYLTHTTEHFYVYSFLDPKNGRGLVAGACIGILAGAIVVFIVVRYLIWVRRWITETKLGMTGKLSSRQKTNEPSGEADRMEMANPTKSSVLDVEEG